MAQCTPKSFDLTGKVALITGASYGIGMAIAKAMAANGATIVFNDIKQELVDKLGPIEHKAEELFEVLCDSYCRYTSAASGKTQDELLDICEGCPLSRLGDLIGV